MNCLTHVIVKIASKLLHWPVPVDRHLLIRPANGYPTMTELPKEGHPALRAQALPARMHLDKWLPLLVLALALALTLHAWQREALTAERELQHDFDFHVQEAIGLIGQRLAAYQQVLHGARGLFTASSNVDRSEFRSYVNALRLQQSHPGIQDLFFVRNIPPAGGAREKNPGEGYIPVAFQESLADDGTSPFGPDVYSNVARRVAMEYARDNGTVAISRKIALPSGIPGMSEPGFVMYLPVYRNGLTPVTQAQFRASLVGWIAAPIRIAELMAPPARGDEFELDVEVYDGDKVATSALLFDMDNEPLQQAKIPSRYQAVSMLQVANQDWSVVVRSLPPFEARLDRSSTVGAWFGIGSSLLLATITWLLAGSRARAVEAARGLHRELIERETRYREMFERSASIAFVIDPDSGRIMDANGAAEAFWQYPPHRVRRMSIFDIDVAPYDNLAAFLREVSARNASHFERQHRLATGELRDVEVYAGKITYRGKVLIYAMLHDITSRKQAEQAVRASEERFRLIAENTGDVIWMMDAESLQFTYISPSIQRQRGFTPDEMMALHRAAQATPTPLSAKNMAQMQQRLRERIHAYIAGDESARRESNEIDQPHKDGRIIPLEVVSTLLCDENNVPRAIIGVSRDISARRQAQEEQKRFVAMVSHEFRTPLATIDGAVQRLQATTGEADEATQKRYTKIQKAVDRLTALLDDYLTQDRIDSAGHGLHLSLASPIALLWDAQASAKALSVDHEIEVDARDAPKHFLCDVDRLRLTLRVLADNAVKYTPPGSRITLRARGMAHGGIEFVVADNGNGIPENELPHVFDKFFRGQGASQQSGSGLGLHMARAVAEMHGGTLSAGNRPAGGAQFTLWLPGGMRPALKGQGLSAAHPQDSRRTAALLSPHTPPASHEFHIPNQ